jgi:hypothetical protein
MLLYTCPHTAMYVELVLYVAGVLQVLQSDALLVRIYICALILLYTCPQTAIYVSSYCYICGAGVAE